MSKNVLHLFPHNVDMEFMGKWYQKAVDTCIGAYDREKLMAHGHLTNAEGASYDIAKETCVPEGDHGMKSVFLQVFDACHVPELTKTTESFKACTEFFKERALLFYQERSRCHRSYITGENKSQEALQACVAAAQKNFEQDLQSQTQFFAKNVGSNSEFQESIFAINSLFKGICLGVVVVGGIALSVGIIKKCLNHFSDKKSHRL